MAAPTADVVQIFAAYTLLVVSLAAFVLSIAGVALIGIAVWEAVAYARTHRFTHSGQFARFRFVHATRRQF
jgi:hypothetical protein